MPDLTTASAVSTWLAMPAPTAAVAAPALAALVTATSADFLRAIDRVDFLEGLYNEVRTGDGGPRIALRHWPIASVTSLTVAGATVSQSAVPGDGGWYIDSQLDPERVNQLYLSGTYFTDNARVAVSYLAGYGAIPADVAQAVVEWVADRYKGRPGQGVTSQRDAGGEHVTYDKADVMPPTTAAVVNRYKRIWPNLDRRTEERDYRVTRINHTITTKEKD